MHATLVHGLLFTLVVAVGCGTLSGVARLLAQGMKLELPSFSGRQLIAALLGVGFAGALGQLLFALLHDRLGMGFPIARLLSWLFVGCLATLATSVATPYMPRRRSVVVGALAGLASWLAFSGLLATYGEAMARQGSVLAFWMVLPLAVLFPLPVLEFVPCEGCDCGQQEAQESPAPLLGLPAPVAVTRQDSVGALLGVGEKPPLPGRLGIPGRGLMPGARASSGDIGRKK
jgi:MFS family permease